MHGKRTPLANKLRELLRGEFADGAHVGQLAQRVARDKANVRCALRSMPDVYRDRWEPNGRPGRYRAIYCAVPVPTDTPAPAGMVEVDNE